MFSSRFMLFPTFKQNKNWCTKNFSGGGGGSKLPCFELSLNRLQLDLISLLVKFPYETTGRYDFLEVKRVILTIV